MAQFTTAKTYLIGSVVLSLAGCAAVTLNSQPVAPQFYGIWRNTNTRIYNWLEIDANNVVTFGLTEWGDGRCIPTAVEGSGTRSRHSSRGFGRFRANVDCVEWDRVVDSREACDPRICAGVACGDLPRVWRGILSGWGTVWSAGQLTPVRGTCPPEDVAGARASSVVPEWRLPNTPNTVTPAGLIQRLQPRGWARIFCDPSPDQPGRVAH